MKKKEKKQETYHHHHHHHRRRRRRRWIIGVRFPTGEVPFSLLPRRD